MSSKTSQKYAILLNLLSSDYFKIIQKDLIFLENSSHGPKQPFHQVDANYDVRAQSTIHTKTSCYLETRSNSRTGVLKLM